MRNIRSFYVTIVQIYIKKFLPFRAGVSVCTKICNYIYNYKKHWIFAVFSAFILFRTQKYDMISIIQSNTRLCKQTHDFFQQNWGVRMHTNESAENYLETILILSKSHPVVRSVDVASELGFKKSSVSVAMKKLRETDQITVSPEGYLYLTESGRATAEKIYERHLFLSEWLEKLGVDPVVAASDACKIEHVISTESFAAIKKHIDLDSME